MTKSDNKDLSKRERQIMDILHRLGEGSVNDVIDQLTNPSGYNSIRMLMNILERKGHLQHRSEKKKFIYAPTLNKAVAKKSALNHILSTYFDKSVPNVVSTLLTDRKLTVEELDELSMMIEKAKEKKGLK